MTAPSTPSRWATEPFVMGSPEQFARLREWLIAVGYTTDVLHRTAGVTTLGHFKALDGGRTVFAIPADPLSMLVHLFLDCAHVPWPEVRRVLPPEGVEALDALGLLQPSVADPGMCVAPVSVFPLEDVYVACDRLHRMEYVGDDAPSDLVFSPLTRETRSFVRMMPRIRAGTYLELCAGTGIAALIAARHFAGRAYSADITERSTRFARFNAALNGLDNFVAVQGDMYEPVEGMTFDLITAHPPYVPAESNEMVFRDGGIDGEQLIRRVLGGVADYLNPGGVLYLECVVTDRAGEPLEERVRRMMGPTEDEMDLLVVTGRSVDADHFHASRLAKKRATPEQFLRHSEYFKRAGIEQLQSVSVFARKRDRARPVVTKRVAASESTLAAHALWFLDHLAGRVEWGEAECLGLLDQRPVALPGVELRRRELLRNGAWMTEGLAVRTTVPFASQAECAEWFPEMLRGCNGTVTVREHLARLKAAGAIPQTTEERPFAELVRELTAAPCLALASDPLPDVPAVPGVDAPSDSLDARSRAPHASPPAP